MPSCASLIYLASLAQATVGSSVVKHVSSRLSTEGGPLANAGLDRSPPRRSAEQYLESLRDGRRVYVAGQRVDDVTRFLPFAPILGTITRIIAAGSLRWTRALDPRFALRLPLTRGDLDERRRAVQDLAEHSLGLLGRLNDYKLSYLLDIYSLRSLLAESCPEGPARLARYVDYCRKENPILCHALTHPQVDRSRTPLENGAIRVEAVEDSGVVLSGARMVATLAPFANELMIVPFGTYQDEQADLAVFCAVPLNEPGVSLHLRPIDIRTDDLLAPFDEPDAAVYLDRVRVPRERVFLCRSVGAANKLFHYATPLAYFAALARAVVRLEFLTGVGRALLHAIGAASFVQNKVALGDAASDLLVVRGMLYGAMDEAEEDPLREYLVPKMEYLWAGLIKAENAARRAVQLILEQTGCGVLMRLDPTMITDANERSKLEGICAGPELSSSSKAALWKLAWSVGAGPVGARQLLFDRHAFGDFFSLRMHLGLRYDWRRGFELVQMALRPNRD